MVEKATLTLDDGARDLQQRVAAILQRLDQMARLLQMRAHGCVVGAVVGAPDQAGVLVVDAHARHGVLIQIDTPRAIFLRHDHIGNDVLTGRRSNGLTRARMQQLDDAHDLLQLFTLHAQQAHQLREVAVSEHGEMLLEQFGSFGQPGRVFGQLA